MGKIAKGLDTVVQKRGGCSDVLRTSIINDKYLFFVHYYLHLWLPIRQVIREGRVMYSFLIF